MQTQQEYLVRTSGFEGPLDLLLNLIQKRKLFINEISLSSVTDDYLQYIQNVKQQKLTDKTSFISIAATLILIKSKSLLPNLVLSKDEESDVERLETRLLLYKIIQETAQSIKSVFRKKITVGRPATKSVLEAVFSPDANITQDIMLACINDVTKAIPIPQEKKPEILIEKVMSLEDMMGDLTSRIHKSLSFSFKDISASGNHATDRGKRVHVIVSFLAVLELVRQGIVGAMQGEDHNEIQISPEENKKLEYEK